MEPVSLTLGAIAAALVAKAAARPQSEPWKAVPEC